MRAAAIALVLLFLFSPLYPSPRKIAGLPEQDGRLTVKYTREAVSAGLDMEAEEVLKLRKKRGAIHRDFSVYVFDSAAEALGAAEILNNQGITEFAEPDYIRRALYTPLAGGPNDPFYAAPAPEPGNNQYGYALVGADAAFAAGIIDPNQSITVIVAVLDSGVGMSPVLHEDLAGITVNGYNAINPGGQTFDDDLTGGHGTHCAGIIAANTNNGMGMAGCAFTGVTWNARVLVMPVKVLDEYGNGYDSDVYEGVKWAVDNGAKVLNYSFGGYSPSHVLRAAMNYASSKGSLNIAAAGNDDTAAFYPAAYSNVISVAACDQNSQRADFSNYGKIDVTAPGVSVLSTSNQGLSSYTQQSGTSFSAPFVAGLGGLMFLKYPGWDADKVREVIERTCDDIGTAGYDNKTGWGLINFTKALGGQIAQPPAAEGIKTYAWPNPFSPVNDIFTNITIVNPGGFQEMKAEVYDGSGAKIWEQNINPQAGYITIKWDGKNASGKPAANGTYFYVIKTPKISGRNKITIVH